MSKVKLYKKLVEVQKQLEPIIESGKNNFQNYTYATAVDVIEPVKKVCNQQGLFLFLDIVESHIQSGKAQCKLKLTIADSETGEELSTTSFGYAEDWSYKENRPTGDKAIYKAITGAMKYALRGTFALPSTDDPENDNSNSNQKNSSKNHFNKKSLPPHKNIQRKDDLEKQVVTEKQLKLLCTIASERGLDPQTDVKLIIKEFGYESKKDILQSDLDNIIAKVKQAEKFVTYDQLQKFKEWRESKGISIEFSRSILLACGYNNPQEISREGLEDMRNLMWSEFNKQRALKSG